MSESGALQLVLSLVWLVCSIIAMIGFIWHAIQHGPNSPEAAAFLALSIAARLAGQRELDARRA